MVCDGVFQSGQLDLLVGLDCCFSVICRVAVALRDVLWCVSICSVWSFGQS